MDEATRVPGLWQGIQTVLCCSKCKAQRPRRQSEMPISISTISTIRSQSPRTKYSHASGSIPVFLSSADTLSFNMFGTLSDDVSMYDVEKRRPMVFSVHRPQRLTKIEMSAQGNAERSLQVPSLNATLRGKIYGDYWNPNSKQKANWDSFFESQSSMMLTQGNISSEGHHDDTTDWAESDAYSSLPEVPNILDASLSRHSSSPGLSRRKGDVLVSYVAPKGMRYAFVPSDIRLEKVSGWLNQGSAHAIPICEHVHPKLRRPMKKNPVEFLNRTLSDLFGDELDPEKNGITFFIGPVDGRVSFKMSVCELDALKKATKDIQSEETPLKNGGSEQSLILN